MNINQMISQYVETAFWTDEEKLEKYNDISGEVYLQAFNDCNMLIDLISSDSTLTIDTNILDQYGHDFWLTRNGHSVGFLDRPEIYGEYESERLEQLVNENFMNSYLYVGDDKLVYLE